MKSSQDYESPPEPPGNLTLAVKQPQLTLQPFLARRVAPVEEPEKQARTKFRGRVVPKTFQAKADVTRNTHIAVPALATELDAEPVSGGAAEITHRLNNNAIVQPAQKLEKLVTLEQGAKQTGLPLWQLQRAVRRGTLPSYTPFNSRRLIYLSELQSLILASRQGGES